MAAEIQAIFDAENGVWGARRITAELNDPTHRDGATTAAKRINRKKVARLMQAQNLFGFQNKRRVKTIRARQVPRSLPRQTIRPRHLRAHELPAIGRSDGRAWPCSVLLTVARHGVLCHTCSLPGVLRAGRHI